MIIVNSIVALICPTILGYLTVTVLLKNRAAFLERVSLAFPLGTGLLTVVMFYIGLIKIPFSAFAILLPIIIVSAFMVYLLKKKDIKPLNLQVNFSVFREMPLYKQVLTVILFGWIILKLISIFCVTLTLPVWSPDSWLNWSTRAFIFYHDKGLSLHPENVFAKSIGQYTYPPHNSLLQVWFAICMGTFDRVLVKLWVPMYLVSSAVFLYATVRRNLDQAWSGIVVILFLSSPLMMLHATEPYSDMILGIYIMFALVSFWRLINSKKEYAFMCGLFSSQALFVKNDAIFFVSGLIVTFLLWTLKEKSTRVLILYYLIPFVLLIPYIGFKLYYNIGFEQVDWGVHLKRTFSFHSESFAEILRRYWQTIDNFNFLLLSTLGLSFFLYIFKIRKTLLLYVILPVIFYILPFIVLYVFSDDHVIFLFNGSTFFRNFLTYYPALFFITYLMFAIIFKKINNSAQPRELKGNSCQV
ncbi:MAG: hypothetical protein HY755_11795 [Nitrospirae bacterium]|nr:hypothetical protein [Nitrospirota bacterium]